MILGANLGGAYANMEGLIFKILWYYDV